MKIVWDYTIEKVELTEAQKKELFHYGANTYAIDNAPKEIKELEEGSYMVVETGGFFLVKNHMLEEWNIHVHEITFGLRKSNVLRDYLEAIDDIEEQVRMGEVLAEITVFNNDLDTPLEFVGDTAAMKPYFKKSIEVLKHDDDSGWYSLIVNGDEVANVVYNEDDEKYSSYDGVDGCGWYDTIKEAVKSFMEWNYRYPTDEEEHHVNCHTCGDGGCYNCEPYRFL